MVDRTIISLLGGHPLYIYPVYALEAIMGQNAMIHSELLHSLIQCAMRRRFMQWSFEPPVSPGSGRRAPELCFQDLFLPP